MDFICAQMKWMFKKNGCMWLWFVVMRNITIKRKYYGTEYHGQTMTSWFWARFNLYYYIHFIYQVWIFASSNTKLTPVSDHDYSWCENL